MAALPDLPGIRPAPAWLTDMGNPAAIKAITDALPFGAVTAAPPQQPPATVPGGGASSLTGGSGNASLAGGSGNSIVAPAPAPPAPGDTLTGADSIGGAAACP
jgi:hypothetical protein